jgi:hypothetical protein
MDDAARIDDAVADNGGIMMAAGQRADEDLLHRGYTFVGGDSLRASVGAHGAAWTALLALWDDLGDDPYLQGDYMFRSRRYGTVGLVPRTGEIRMHSPSTFFQPSAINPYAGDIVRTFAPLPDGLATDDIFAGLLGSSFDRFGVEEEYLDAEWVLDVNLFRLRVEGARVTEPTPEGIHRDGVPFGTVHVVRRHLVEGGVSQVYTMDEKLVDVRLLEEPLDTLCAFDNRLKHYATPIYAQTMAEGYRDTLVYGFSLPDTKYQKD